MADNTDPQILSSTSPANPHPFDQLIIGDRRYGLDRLPDPAGKLSALPSFREAYPLVPESKWNESDQFTTWNTPVLDQIQNGCVGHGGCSMFFNAWVAAGNDPVDFSPTWFYALTNGGRDQGAFIGDLLAAAQVGLCLASTFPESKYFLGGAAEKAARAEAANYQIDPNDGYVIDNSDGTGWEQVGTALHHGYAVADSVMVGNSFMYGTTRIGPNNLMLVPVNRGSGNHCVVAGGLIRQGGKVYKQKQTSWGTQTPFGPNGRFFTAKEHDVSQGQGYSAVVLKTVKRKPGNGLVGPVG